MAEVVEAARFAVTLAGGVDQRQRARRADAGLDLGGEEALLERDGDPFREADADKTAGREGVAIVDQSHCLGGADDLVGRRRVRSTGVWRVKLHGSAGMVQVAAIPDCAPPSSGLPPDIPHGHGEIQRASPGHSESE